MTCRASLGIEGIWLTPVFRSPSYHKYDVTNYYQIDPAFGTEEDLKELIALCHERDVKLILDLPLNHTGENNEWFINFRNAHQNGDPDDPFYNFYTWMPSEAPAPAGRRFRNFGSLSLKVEANFSDQMPELNFDNEQVRQAVLDVAVYWLNLGVDGFRFDAAKYPYYGEHDRNAEFWEWYMAELKKINPDIYTVAEVWDGDAIIDRYLKAFNCFHFSTALVEGLIAETALGGDVNRFAQATQSYLKEIHDINPEAMNIPFIANHDTDRAAGFLTVASGSMHMAANLYILMPGSPFLYYGEEIGLRGSRGGANTDANRRLAMCWGDGGPGKEQRVHPVALPQADRAPEDLSGDCPGRIHSPEVQQHETGRLALHPGRQHGGRIPQHNGKDAEGGPGGGNGPGVYRDRGVAVRGSL